MAISLGKRVVTFNYRLAGLLAGQFVQELMGQQLADRLAPPEQDCHLAGLESVEHLGDCHLAGLESVEH